LKYQGIVLRTRPYRDADLIVDLLIAELGRISAIARGGRSSKRRFTGALETGARLNVTLTRRGSGQLYTLNGCDIIHVPMQARQDLARFYQLAYVVDVINAVTVEGQTEEINLHALWRYLDRLEVETPSHADLVQWELFMLAQNGYHLRFWPCVVTEGIPNAFSFQMGGAVDVRSTQASDSISVSSDGLQCLETMRLGVFQGCENRIHEEIRSLINQVWVFTLDRALKSVAFIGPESFAEERPLNGHAAVASVDLQSDISQAGCPLNNTIQR
jgi:DNA repair protein RecO